MCQQASRRNLNARLAHLVIVYGDVIQPILRQQLSDFFHCNEALSEYEDLIFSDLQHGRLDSSICLVSI